MNPAAHTADYSKALNQQRTYRSSILEEYWARPYEPPASSPESQSVGATATNVNQSTSPRLGSVYIGSKRSHMPALSANAPTDGPASRKGEEGTDPIVGSNTTDMNDISHLLVYSPDDGVSVSEVSVQSRGAPSNPSSALPEAFSEGKHVNTNGGKTEVLVENSETSASPGEKRRPGKAADEVSTARQGQSDYVEDHNCLFSGFLDHNALMGSSVRNGIHHEDYFVLAVDLTAALMRVL